MSREESKKNICPVCHREYEYALSVHIDKGKQTCLHDSDVPQKSKAQIKRHANYEASVYVLKLAADQKRADVEMGKDKMVDIRSTQKGSAGQITRLPEFVIKSIEEKVAPELE